MERPGARSPQARTGRTQTGWRTVRCQAVSRKQSRISNGYALEAGSSRQIFALSPDGTRLAFTAMDASGMGTVFIRDLDGLDSLPLANSMGAYHVFWAPDGRSLFFTLGGRLRRSTLDNDSFQVVCDTPPMMLTGAVLGPVLLISGRTDSPVRPPWRRFSGQRAIGPQLWANDLWVIPTWRTYLARAAGERGTLE